MRLTLFTLIAAGLLALLSGRGYRHGGQYRCRLEHVDRYRTRPSSRTPVAVLLPAEPEAHTVEGQRPSPAQHPLGELERGADQIQAGVE